MALTIACVRVGRKYGPEYVAHLASMCRRHIGEPFTFACLTDKPDELPAGTEYRSITGEAWGWWVKLELFKPGQFPASCRVLYFDLDTVILANIDDLARYDGQFAGLGCARSNRLFSSGIMAWEAGTVDRIWSEWLAANKPLLGSGDDEWIDRVCPHAHRLQHKFPGLYQYKYHKCRVAPPVDARIVYFTREPKPHNCGSQWVREAWQ